MDLELVYSLEFGRDRDGRYEREYYDDTYVYDVEDFHGSSSPSDDDEDDAPVEPNYPDDEIPF